MTTSETTPILPTTTTTSEEPTVFADRKLGSYPKPKKPRKPRQSKPKVPKVVEEPKKEVPSFMAKYGTYAVFLAVILGVLGVKNFHKIGDWTTPTPTPAPAPVEPSVEATKAKAIALQYFNSLAKDFDETRAEIEAKKYEDVSGWANALLKRTTASKDTFATSLNDMLGPVAGQTTVTPETTKLLEEISNGWKSLK